MRIMEGAGINLQGFTVILNNILMLSILMALGYVSAKTKYLPYPGKVKDTISKLLLKLMLPLLIITALTRQELTGGMVVGALTIAGVAAAVIPLMFFLAWWIGKLLKMPYRTLVVHCCLCTYGNVVFLAYPLLSALYGAEGLFYTAIYGMINDLFFYTLGIFMIAKCSNQGKVRVAWKRLFNPLTISFGVAVIMMAFRIQLPAWLFEPLDMVAQCTIPLAMLFIGIVLAEVKFTNVFRPWTKWIGMLIKQIVIPVILILVLRPFGMAPTVLSVIVMQVAMPSQTMVSVLANEYGADQIYAAEAIFLSMILSIGTLPLIYRLIEYMLPM